jgi:hypothetical protein
MSAPQTFSAAAMTSPTAAQPALKCPVCAAAFRGVEICPRCSVNLEPLMQLAARAWALRELSRKKLREGNLPEAMRFAAAAWQIQRQGKLDFTVRAP